MTAFYVRCIDNVIGPLSGVELREAAVAQLVTPGTPVAAKPTGPWSRATNARGLFDGSGQPLPHPTSTSVPRWRLRTSRGEFGPFPLHTLLRLLKDGAITADSVVRAEDSKHWLPLKSVTSLVQMLPAPPHKPSRYSSSCDVGNVSENSTLVQARPSVKQCISQKTTSVALDLPDNTATLENLDFSVIANAMIPHLSKFECDTLLPMAVGQVVQKASRPRRCLAAMVTSLPFCMTAGGLRLLLGLEGLVGACVSGALASPLFLMYRSLSGAIRQPVVVFLGVDQGIILRMYRKEQLVPVMLGLKKVEYHYFIYQVITFPYSCAKQTVTGKIWLNLDGAKHRTYLMLREPRGTPHQISKQVEQNLKYIPQVFML